MSAPIGGEEKKDTIDFSIANVNETSQDLKETYYSQRREITPFSNKKGLTFKVYLRK